MDLDRITEGLLEQLFEKYRLSGQKTNDYLEGLLVSNYEPYWKYLHLDTLLSLQNPKTDFDDEFIFIAYHQITELYFRLILHELEKLRTPAINPHAFEEVITRVNRYLRHLIVSFEIMIDGMNPEAFLKFRMALLPASGFQSYQFRLIEICLTDLSNLVSLEYRNSHEIATADGLYGNIYWKKGAIDAGTGEKTLTLKQFEKQYDSMLINVAKECEGCHVLAVFKRLKSEGKLTHNIEESMRTLDQNLNVNWRLAHYKSAVRYLHKNTGDVSATGGTNWQKFLPPRFQKVISFPELWSQEAIENWGKHWVDENISTT